MKTFQLASTIILVGVLLASCTDSLLDDGGSTKPDRIGLLKESIAGKSQLGCVEPLEGLLAWWPMDGSGAELIAGRDGTPVGDGGFDIGHVGGAYLPAAASPVVVPKDPALAQEKMTISFWVRLDDFNSYNMIPIWNGESGGADASNPFAIGINHRGSIFAIVGNGTTRDILYTSERLTRGSFRHVVVSFDGQSIKIYVDGVLDASKAQTVNSQGTPYDLRLGAIHNAGYWLNGALDEVMFFDRALTPAEIAAIHTAGSAGLCKDEFLDEDSDGVTVNLGSAGNFAILSKSGITNVPTSSIVGDVGTSPITGAALLLTCAEVTGNVFTVDAAGPLPCTQTEPADLTGAVLDMEAAYTDAAGRANPDYIEWGAGEIGGLTLTPGIYKWGTGVLITTDVTLDGGPNDVWILQVAGTLTQASAKRVILTGGAQAKNIFWAVAGAVTIGTTAHFEGILLAKTSVALKTGASVNGRLMAQTAVTLQMNTVN